VALVRSDVSEQLSASFIRVTRLGELGTTLAVTSNRRTPRCIFFLVSEMSDVESEIVAYRANIYVDRHTYR
jgi:hypothetical protein